MPYSKRNQKCKNASGESGTFVTIKKDGGKRTCWKNKAAFEKATAARHSKGVKQEMKMTESKLRQIIIEELARIDNEEKLRDLYVEAFQRAGIEANLIEGRDWFPIVTTGVAIGALGALMTIQGAHNDKVAADGAARAAASAKHLGSIETKTAEMNKQLTNMTAWSWTDDEDPTSREAFPMIEFDDVPELEGKKFTVMPPEYAIFLQVKKDKEAGIMRYGAPGSMEDVKDLQKDLKTAAGNVESESEADRNRIDFVNNFDSPQLYDTLSSEVGIYGVGGQMYTDDAGMLKQAQAIMPDFDKLESYYGGPLPLTGLSVEDTYNSFMFGTYLSNDEIEDIEIEITDSENINPELIAKTRQHSADIEK